MAFKRFIGITFYDLGCQCISYPLPQYSLVLNIIYSYPCELSKVMRQILLRTGPYSEQKLLEVERKSSRMGQWRQRKENIQIKCRRENEPRNLKNQGTIFFLIPRENNWRVCSVKLENPSKPSLLLKLWKTNSYKLNFTENYEGRIPW